MNRAPSQRVPRPAAFPAARIGVAAPWHWWRWRRYQLRTRLLEAIDRWVAQRPDWQRRCRLPRPVELDLAGWARGRDGKPPGLTVFEQLPRDRPEALRLPHALVGQPPVAWSELIEAAPAERFYFELQGGELVFEPWRCAAAVIPPDGRILHQAVQLFFHSPENHPVRHSVLVNRRRRLPGRAFLLFNDATPNYYHWMCDILPRLHVARLAGHEIDSFDFFLTDELEQPFHRDTLEALGVPLDRVVIATHHRRIAPDVACIASLNDRSGTVQRDGLVFVRDALLRFSDRLPAADTPRRVYIDRQRSSGRRVVNWHEIQRVLADFDVQPVRAESLSLSEQVRLFRQAEWIVGPHGAGLTNLMFCRPGTRVLELISPGWAQPMYWIMSQRLELDYSLILTTLVRRHMAAIDDMYIDPVAFRRALQTLESGGARHQSPDPSRNLLP